MSEVAERQRISRLLIVEDDAAQLRTLTHIMRDEGFEVIGCATASEALGHVRDRDFAVAIIDLRLPDLSGTQLLEKLRAMNGQVRVIIHTGYGSFDSAKAAVNLGACAYVEKLSDPAELIGHVHRAFRERFSRYAEDLEAAVAERTAALAQSEQRYRAIAEDTPVLICRFLPGGEITYVNAAYCKYFEKTSAELVGSSLLPLIHETDRETVMANISALTVDSPTQSHEHQVIVPGGDICWQRWTKRALFDAQGQVVAYQSVGEDITERKEAEQRHKESEERYKRMSEEFESILDRLPALVFYKDTENRFIRVNQYVADAYQMTKKEMEGKSLFDMYPKDQAQAYMDDDLEVINSRKPKLNIVEPWPTSEGLRWVHTGKIPFTDAKGDIVGLIGISIDITDRKRAEEALRENVRLNQVLLDAFPCVALLMRPQTREIVVSNKAAMEIGAVPGTTCFGTWAQRTDPCPWCLAPEVWATGESRHLEVQYMGIDWDAYWIPVSADLYMHFAFDVTDRKRAQRDKQTLQAQLHQSQKLEAVGQLAGGVAHDFNNLLTAITGYAELLEPAITEDTAAAQALEGIQEAARQAAGVTRSLLTFSAKIPPHKERVELRCLVQKTTRLLERMIPASISIATDPPDEPPVWLYADGTQLQQIIMNLAVNARDAMPDGGTLRISVAELCGEAAQAACRGLEAAELPADRCARLIVSDTGTGMSAEVKERVFEPFFTTKAREQGTGLGLAIVHGIVTEHGGRIEIDSAPGEGTTFTITLPMVDAADAGAVEEQVRGESGAAGELVLLAEDNWDVRSIVGTALKRRGFQVLEATDGSSLMKRFAEHVDDIRLLVLDVDLPRRSGLDCLREIRGRGVNTPAIVITGGVDAAIEDDVDEHSVLLRKPFSMSELQRLAADLVSGRCCREA